VKRNDSDYLANEVVLNSSRTCDAPGSYHVRVDSSSSCTARNYAAGAATTGDDGIDIGCSRSDCFSGPRSWPHDGASGLGAIEVDMFTTNAG
jgi:hypothetical protein